MRATPLELPGVMLIEPAIAVDERGAFFEAWNVRSLAAAGICATLVQENVSVSRRFALRGLHYQLEPAQGKLIRVLQGEIFDVVVDLRRGSAGFGRSLPRQLVAHDHRCLWIPPGFAHGFLSLSENTQVQYAVTEYWNPASERTLAWNDPALAIPWPLPPNTTPLLSEKDRRGAPLALADSFP